LACSEIPGEDLGRVVGQGLEAPFSETNPFGVARQR
jgi:hypothetical protein